MNEEKRKAELAECFRKDEISLTSGVKYGTDFLVYLGEPGSVHSSFTATSDESISFKTVSALVRVSSSTKKDFVLFTPGEKNSVFTRFKRFFL